MEPRELFTLIGAFEYLRIVKEVDSSGTEVML